MTTKHLRRISADEVRRAASGRWHEILTDLAPALELALERPGRHVPCPVHGGRDGFRLFRDYRDTGGGICNTCGPVPNGLGLLMWVNYWRFTEALAAVAEWLKLLPWDGVERETQRRHSARQTTVQQPNTANLPLAPLIYRDADADARLCAVIAKIWSESISLLHHKAVPAQRYLQGRRIPLRQVTDLGDALRFHPQLEYRDEAGTVIGDYPGIVAAVTDPKGEMVTLQRIYLTVDGRKAPVETPKKMMPVPNGKAVTGASIKLGKPTESVLGVAEGIETALAVCTGSGMVTWSVLNATLLESFVPPDDVRTLFIWADLDREHRGKRRGEEAAKRLSERLERCGIRSQTFLPPLPIPAGAKGVDWNDAWTLLRFGGFPSRLALGRVA
ncbi:DNA primase [Sulfurifustis variabilis]|uniref:DNA primase n=1 Tax=Sulfurifustis variabilis TaxID=1675686 RepID=A0A1B4VCQ8_9GAMM|nr:primase-helicase zinc-binding domain-containing protein [Sulfurifustis variabilis]BAU49601.1 DNA primase [Sulfurifustis variabilis]